MKYIRKTTPKWQRDAYKVMLVVFMVASGMGHVSKRIEANWKNNNPIVTPISDKEILVVDVEREVIVHELPQTVEEKIRSVFTQEPDLAVKVAKCESGLNPNAKNKTSSARGLFQVMQSWHKIDERWLLNEDINIQVAHSLYQDQGWTPWRASNHCHHALVNN